MCWAIPSAAQPTSCDKQGGGRGLLWFPLKDSFCATTPPCTLVPSKSRAYKVSIEGGAMKLYFKIEI